MKAILASWVQSRVERGLRVKIRVIAATKVLDLAFFENPEASDSQLMVRLPHRSVAGSV